MWEGRSKKGEINFNSQYLGLVSSAYNCNSIEWGSWMLLQESVDSLPSESSAAHKESNEA